MYTTFLQSIIYDHCEVQLKIPLFAHTFYTHLTVQCLKLARYIVLMKYAHCVQYVLSQFNIPELG